MLTKVIEKCFIVILLSIVKYLLNPTFSYYLQKNQIRENATKYLNLISELLNRVPRQLLLLFKTNDLLRSIDHTLNTSATARSFITMARCCVRAVTSQRLEQCHSWYCRLGVYFKAAMSHIRISCYQLSESNIGSFLLRIFESVRCRKLLGNS